LVKIKNSLKKVTNGYKSPLVKINSGLRNTVSIAQIIKSNLLTPKRRRNGYKNPLVKIKNTLKKYQSELKRNKPHTLKGYLRQVYGPTWSKQGSSATRPPNTFLGNLMSKLSTNINRQFDEFNTADSLGVSQ
jgi:hypothetical protein